MSNGFQKNAFQVVKEGQEDILKIDCRAAGISPSLEDDPVTMMLVTEKLVEFPGVKRINLYLNKNYSYNYHQTQLLVEIANVYNALVRQRKIWGLILDQGHASYLGDRLKNLQNLVYGLIKSDPIGAFVEIKRLRRESRIKLKNGENNYEKDYYDFTDQVYNLIKNTGLINQTREELEGYELGDRGVYRLVFRPSVTPDFMFSRLQAQPPMNAEQIDIYTVGDADIGIYKIPGEIKYLYQLNPPEFKLTEEEYALLDVARGVIREHQPSEEDFLEPERVRATFFNISKDLVTELADQKGIELSLEKLNVLSEILVRYTVGFGLIEVLLDDEKIQDITINSPTGESPIFIVHQDYGHCFTNITSSSEDVQGWATKFRILSGRALDEANPILDTELILPRSRARVAIITAPLNPYGIGYAFRRHRDKPWTLPLFIKNKMMNSMAAGLLSFIIDGNRTLLFCGTRSSGKTSVLGAGITEIMRRYRIISVEDSVTGDSELLIKRDGTWERTTMGGLIDALLEEYGSWYNLSGHEILGNSEGIEVLAMDKTGKIKATKVSKFIRHKVSKPIYKILTRTGREIKVTGDHSLFGLDKEGKISEIKVSELSEGSFIATPRFLKTEGKFRKSINLLDYLDKFGNVYLYGGNIKKFLKYHYYEVKQLCKDHGYSNRSVWGKWFKKGIVPIKILSDLRALGYNLKLIEGAFIKAAGCSRGLPVNIDLDEDLFILVGLWLGDGCYDKKSVIVSSTTPEERQVVYNVAKKFGLGVSNHTDNWSLIINSVVFRTFLREVLELKGDAYTKRIPGWVFALPNQQTGLVLKGLFSADGCIAKNEIILTLSSLKMLKDVQTLLLRFGIIHRIRGYKKRDKTYPSSISSTQSIKQFLNIGVLQKYKQDKLRLLADKISTHDSTDVVPLETETKQILSKMVNNFNCNDYIKRVNNIGIRKLSGLLSTCLCLENPLLSNLKILTDSDIFWDEIKSIELIKNFKGYVYDLSVSECESFVVENVIAHNTLELPMEAFRKLGYNVQPMKVRSALASGGTELSADEGIRTSLRMGDSALIVGEVRSMEARSLYESMRIGALANVVAGTIHGESPYGVFDRVVNDLGVPKTSFKATDLIVLSNPVRSPDGLSYVRRILQITEVRKHWQDDPLKEGGFMDLMKYNPKTDQLEITDDLRNGDSELLKSIASNVKEWAGNWEAVWDNILLRAKIKQALVDYSINIGRPELLEADFVVKANDMFHIILESVKSETGYLNSEKIYNEWVSWLEKNSGKSNN